MPLKVRYNYPVRWGSSLSGLKSNYIQQTIDGLGRWDDCVFEINNDTAECDFWVVHGDLEDVSTANVHKATVFILSEEVEQRVWDDRFLAQFDIVLGSQERVNHPNYIRCHTVCPWQVDKSYTELKSLTPPVKSKILSAIVSDSTLKEGHKKRFAFMNQLKGHYKNQLDWYGRGNIFIENKWDALVEYEYSIAIENSVHEHYFTEKLIDCLLAYTLPFYYGCPNVFEYFPEGSIVLLNPNSLEESIQIIEEAIANDHYRKHFSDLEEARRRALDQYQFFPAVKHKLEELAIATTSKMRTVKLRPEAYYTKVPLYKRVVNKVRNNLR